MKGGLEGGEPSSLRREAGDLHRVLDGLRAGVQEDRLRQARRGDLRHPLRQVEVRSVGRDHEADVGEPVQLILRGADHRGRPVPNRLDAEDRKSTRLNSSHQIISYAVFCLKKKKKKKKKTDT